MRFLLSPSAAANLGTFTLVNFISFFFPLFLCRLNGYHHRCFPPVAGALSGSDPPSRSGVRPPSVLTFLKLRFLLSPFHPPFFFLEIVAVAWANLVPTVDFTLLPFSRGHYLPPGFPSLFGDAATVFLVTCFCRPLAFVAKKKPLHSLSSGKPVPTVEPLGGRVADRALVASSSFQ